MPAGIRDREDIARAARLSGRPLRYGGVDAFETVEPSFQSIFSRVWASGTEDARVLHQLTPLERAIYATRIIEGMIDNGGWYAVFYNGVDHLIEPATEGYELLGLPEYAEHLRRVRVTGFGEHSPEATARALDDEYFRLSGSEEARAAALRSTDAAASNLASAPAPRADDTGTSRPLTACVSESGRQ